jgi:hypothetical protein
MGVLQKYEVRALARALKEIDSICNSNLKEEWYEAREIIWQVLDRHGWNITSAYKPYRKE